VLAVQDFNLVGVLICPTHLAVSMLRQSPTKDLSIGSRLFWALARAERCGSHFFASRFGRQTKSRLLVTVMEKQTPTRTSPS